MPGDTTWITPQYAS